MHGLETITQQNAAASAEKKLAKCENIECGKEFEQKGGRGRPRKFCPACRPPRAKKAAEPAPAAQ